MKKVVIIPKKYHHLRSGKVNDNYQKSDCLIDQAVITRTSIPDIDRSQNNHKDLVKKSKSYESFSKTESPEPSNTKHNHIHKLIYKKSNDKTSQENSSPSDVNNESLSQDSKKQKQHYKFYSLGKTKEHKSHSETTSAGEEEKSVKFYLIDHNHDIKSNKSTSHSGTTSPHNIDLKLFASSEATLSKEIPRSNKFPKHPERHSLEISNFNVNPINDCITTSISGNSPASHADASSSKSQKHHSGDRSVINKPNSEVTFSNGNVQIDREGFLEEIDIITNFCGRDMSNLIAGLGGDFSFED